MMLGYSDSMWIGLFADKNHGEHDLRVWHWVAESPAGCPFGQNFMTPFFSKFDPVNDFSNEPN